MQDDLGDRMKATERLRTNEKLDNGPFIYARIDGRGFSKFTKGMDKPFDLSMSQTMIKTTAALVKKTHAIIGYTQSDEISLAWNAETLFFDSKIQKLTSVLASMATSHFIIDGLEYITPSYLLDRYPHFDARIFELPNEDELTNAFLWRYKDAYRNSISMIGQANFSSKQLHKKNMREVREMLASIGVFETDFLNKNIHGTFIVREKHEIETENGSAIRDRLIEVSGDKFGTRDHNGRLEFILGDENEMASNQ